MKKEFGYDWRSVPLPYGLPTPPQLLHCLNETGVVRAGQRPSVLASLVGLRAGRGKARTRSRHIPPSKLFAQEKGTSTGVSLAIHESWDFVPLGKSLRSSTTSIQAASLFCDSILATSFVWLTDCLPCLMSPEPHHRTCPMKAYADLRMLEREVLSSGRSWKLDFLSLSH